MSTYIPLLDNPLIELQLHLSANTFPVSPPSLFAQLAYYSFLRAFRIRKVWRGLFSKSVDWIRRYSLLVLTLTTYVPLLWKGLLIPNQLIIDWNISILISRKSTCIHSYHCYPFMFLTWTICHTKTFFVQWSDIAWLLPIGQLSFPPATPLISQYSSSTNQQSESETLWRDGPTKIFPQKGQPVWTIGIISLILK